jgi:class 3 adenylate cyclase
MRQWNEGVADMGCGSCGHDNEANAKFCSECGAPLMVRCGSCQAEQPPGAKFCNQCGSPITATSAPEPGAEQRAPASNAVRKNVTALFGDLVGSTAFGERVDPEAARSALAPYFEILRSTIEDHAGTVVKFTGDGVMAIFGLPEVAEDDALRAVAAGLELQRRFRGFADSVRDRHGVELGMRVGINTGELVTGDGDADLVGDVLNTAARLEAACQPGRVMVGEDTWRLTRSAVSYEVLGEVRVKGKTDALATFQVVDDDRGVTEDTTPFVGRRDELHALRSAFDDTLSSATSKLVTVIGAPGVGKTRLAAELRSASTLGRSTCASSAAARPRSPRSSNSCAN